MSIRIELTYLDNSTRILVMDPNCAANWVPTRDYQSSRKSFKWLNEEPDFKITPLFIDLLKVTLLRNFNTNPMLWAISVSTCPEELQPYLILPDDQLTYKGTS